MPDPTDPRTVRVYRRLPSGARGLLGCACRKPDGWKFVPQVFGKSSSRRAWPTWEACLPRWVSYPNGCETEVVVPPVTEKG